MLISVYLALVFRFISSKNFLVFAYLFVRNLWIICIWYAKLVSLLFVKVDAIETVIFV